MLVGMEKRVIQSRQEVKGTRRQGSLSGERIFSVLSKFFSVVRAAKGKGGEQG